MARLLLALLASYVAVVSCEEMLAAASARVMTPPPVPIKILADPSKFAMLGTEEQRELRTQKSLCEYSDIINGEVVFDVPALLSRYGLDSDMCDGVIAFGGGSEKDVTCPASVANPRNLAAGSCCSSDSQCGAGLFCDEYDRICTKYCDGEMDCYGLGNFTYTYCVSSTYYTGQPDTCSPCMLYSDCQGVAFCTLCEDYVGPVSDAIRTAANCDAYSYTDSSWDGSWDSSWDSSWSDSSSDWSYDYTYQPDWELICYEVECVIAFYGIIADVFRECYADLCIDDYLQWNSDYNERYYACQKDDGRYCGQLMIDAWYGEYDTVCDQADAAGCCVEALVDTFRFLNYSDEADFFEEYYGECNLEPACPPVNIWDHPAGTNDSDNAVGIALGVLAAVGVVGAVGFCVWRKQRGSAQDRDAAVANNPRYVTMSNPDGGDGSSAQWSQPLNVN